MKKIKEALPKWLTNRLFALYAILMCMIGFILYLITGILQVASTFMAFIVESIEYGRLRWNYIEWNYLKDSFGFLGAILFSLKLLITGKRND